MNRWWLLAAGVVAWLFLRRRPAALPRQEIVKDVEATVAEEEVPMVGVNAATYERAKAAAEGRYLDPGTHFIAAFVRIPLKEAEALGIQYQQSYY